MVPPVALPDRMPPCTKSVVPAMACTHKMPTINRPMEVVSSTPRYTRPAFIDFSVP